MTDMETMPLESRHTAASGPTSPGTPWQHPRRPSSQATQDQNEDLDLLDELLGGLLRQSSVSSPVRGICCL